MALLNVKVVPGARRSEVAGRHGDGVKVRVAAPPEDGKANRALLEVLADALGVRASDLSIIRGHASPHKVVEIDGMDLELVWKKLTARTLRSPDRAGG
jgi:uncharacterized protein